MGDPDESNRDGPLVLFAGGKTGGHLYPGIAVAEEIKRLDPATEIAFCGAGFALPKRECEKRGWPYYETPSAPIYQTNLIQLIMGIFLNTKGMLRAATLLKRTRPDLVICCGGYEGFPVSLAAWRYGVPILLLEQNAVTGLTNRALGPISSAAAVAFPGRRARPASRRIRVTGNAVRTELLSYRPDHKRFGLEPDRLTGLVIGGSAGAQSINQAVIEAAPELAKINGFQLIIQTGDNDCDAVVAAVKKTGMKASVSAYLDPIGSAYATCDFAVARAGGSVFELALLGIPAILVPYPHAAADHQTANARAFVKADAAVLIPDRELTAERLVREIERLVTDHGLRRGMAAAMKRLGRPDAAREAAKLALETAGRFR